MKIYVQIHALFTLLMLTSCTGIHENEQESGHQYNGPYQGEFLSHIAYPLGGMGAGMVCLEGTGALSHVSVYNRPGLYNAPNMFAAIAVRGLEHGVKVLEGPVPDHKKYVLPVAGRGAPGTSYGLPRFEYAEFTAHFPFGKITLQDNDIPLDITITGWSPFIPLDPDNSSLPCAALEYSFVNTGENDMEAVFSFNTVNFMSRAGCSNFIRPSPNGFILSNRPPAASPHLQGDFAFFTDDTATLVDHCWFRGVRTTYDALAITWKHIASAVPRVTPPVEQDAPGASLFVPFILKPGEKKTICLMLAWFAPHSDLRYGEEVDHAMESYIPPPEEWDSFYYRPWYSSGFNNIHEVMDYWSSGYEDLKRRSKEFTDAFYSTTLPAEVVEAIAANLTILKSPVVLRQSDGRLSVFEGCDDTKGLGHGSNTHVWNYAQAIPHLFPTLERSLRETEFMLSQDDSGHQTFNSGLPIREVGHEFFPAADGQLGGIMKAYREWRISGDNGWLQKMAPSIKTSLDFCIREWDPRETGALEEPQHNTFDTRFWGPNGLGTSCYLGALKAFTLIGEYLGQDVSRYRILLEKGKNIMENRLFNGEYFCQKTQWEGLNTPSPLSDTGTILTSPYSGEARSLIRKEGPVHQYGNGCLSNGIMGLWLATVCGMDDEIVDVEKVKNHLRAVYKYNFKTSLADEANTQRSTYAMGEEGGLLNCTWPKQDMPSLPFVYSHEVWTGIEYQVASQLMFSSYTDEGCSVVRTCRTRYDGRSRNPFDEYEWGHWYGRALASYSMIQALTGIQYDAVSKTLYIDSRTGNEFDSFFSCQTGWGNIGMKKGRPFVKMVSGHMEIRTCLVSGKEYPVENILYMAGND